MWVGAVLVVALAVSAAYGLTRESVYRAVGDGELGSSRMFSPRACALPCINSNGILVLVYNGVI